MDLGLRERVALVTGGSSGLGRAIARELARERARVVVMARGEPRLREAVDQIRRETGGQIYYHAGDVLSPDAIDAAVEDTLTRWGRIDIAVANAGGPYNTTFESTQPQQYEHAVNLGLMSTIRLARAVAPHMKRQRWGRFIAVASASVRQSLPELVLANTVRPAVVGFVKSMANELAQHGVLCNVVAPGLMRTGRVEEVIAERADRRGVEPHELLEQAQADIPLGRMGEPEELAQVVAFLASERASYVTGATIAVDGGFVQSVP